MARSEFKQFKDPLARALRGLAGPGEARPLAPVVAEALGPVLSRHAHATGLDGDRLTLEVDPDYLPALDQERDRFLARLSSLLGAGAPRSVRLLPRSRP